MKLLRASSLYRDQNCFANREMSEAAFDSGNLPPEDTPWTERGTRVHEGDTQTEDETDARAYVLARSYEIFDSYAQGQSYQVEHGTRFYLRHDGLVPYFTGEPDRFIALQDSTVWVDFKPGFEADWDGWETQMDAYAALLFEARTVPGVGVIITRFHGTRTYTYTAEQCREIIKRIQQVALVYENEKGLPTNPGPWCRYCKGRLVCKSALVYPLQESLPVESMPGGTVGAEVVTALKRIKQLASDKLNWYQEQVELDPKFLAGIYVLSKGRETGKINDFSEASKALWAKKALNQPQVNECATLSVAKLRDKIAKVHKIPQRQAVEMLQETLGDLISYTTSKGSLIKNNELLEK